MTRRRRRLLIVSAILMAGIAGAWWWMRPNLDPRLIGHWREKGYTFWEDGYTFREDGTLSGFGWEEQGVSTSLGDELEWRVSGDRLILTIAYAGGGDVQEHLYVFYARLRGYRSYRFQIIKITADQMVLRACNDRQPDQTVTTTYFRAAK